MPAVPHSKTIFALFLALTALWIRTTNIDLRPFHHDEGVNHYFLEDTRNKGYYPYSHENYHGPTHFYAISLTTYLFGDDTEQAMRLPPALAGVAMLLLLYYFFPGGSFAFILASILFCFSPSLVFYSRYSIHEMFFTLFTLWFALSVYSWSKSHAPHWIYQGATALALLILTKETYVIAGFCVFWGYLAMRFPKEDIQKLLKSTHHLAGALLLLTILTIVVVTGGLQWSGGIRELFLSVPQWVGRNSSDTGHHKEFLYYTKILWRSEPWLLFLPVIIACAAVLHGIKDRRKLRDILTGPEYDLHRFLTAWALVSYLLYSSLKYKMPWLLINITVPAILAMVCWIQSLVRNQVAQIALCVAGIIVGGYSTYRFNFQIPYGPQNPYSYVHTSKGMMNLLSDIRKRWERHPDDKILVATNQYWPMPYYLRDKKAQVAYIRTDDPEQNAKKYDILVMDKKVKFKKPGWSMRYYRLADNQESHTFYRKRK